MVHVYLNHLTVKQIWEKRAVCYSVECDTLIVAAADDASTCRSKLRKNAAFEKTNWLEKKKTEIIV